MVDDGLLGGCLGFHRCAPGSFYRHAEYIGSSTPRLDESATGHAHESWSLSVAADPKYARCGGWRGLGTPVYVMPGLEKRCQATISTLARALRLGRIDGVGSHDSGENPNVRSRSTRGLWTLHIGLSCAIHCRRCIGGIVVLCVCVGVRISSTKSLHLLMQRMLRYSAQKTPLVRCPSPHRTYRPTHTPGVVLAGQVPHGSHIGFGAWSKST
jgi:hypothetical protein